MGMAAHFCIWRETMRNICKVEGCSDFAHGNGYCGKHYMRIRNHGTLDIECIGQSRVGSHNGFYGVRRFGEDNPFFGKKHTQEAIEQDRQARLGRNHTEETKQKIRSGIVSSIISRRKRGEFHQSPNKSEQVLIDFFEQNNLPFRYVGNGEVWLGNRNPDFINANGRKQVIELLGTYWHPLFDGANRIEHYKQYGFDCLVIWEDELADLPKVFKKITREVKEE